MDSDLHHQQQTQYNNNQQQQQQQIQQPQPTMNLGLTRYRSAPSSYFSNLINSNIMYGDDEISQITDTDMNQVVGFEKQLMDVIKQEESQLLYQDSQAVYESQKQDQFRSQTGQNTRPVSLSSSTVVDTSTTMNMSMNNMNNNLVRQSSSPAGFFANLDIDNGYPMMRSMDDYRVGGGNSSNSLLTSTKRFKNETSFSSGSGLLPRIPENEAKVMEMKGELIDGGFGSNSWDDSDILSDSFLKEFGESDQNKLSSLNSSENQRNNVERIRGPSSLIHHLSLPASTAELDKLMQFQDSVPLRSRAKRGCATHPRSIAERVRRTRISERMRKLQDLVPNMDKQTNTADMLDLAVDYIKELQKEAETLSDHHARCTCPHKQKL